MAQPPHQGNDQDRRQHPSSTGSGRAILGLTPGRSSKSVCTWLDAREQAWREGIEVVAIDPCAAYARWVTASLPAFNVDTSLPNRA